MAPQNDVSVYDGAVLLRVLQRNWVCTDGDRRRPTKQAFQDGNTGEASCFVDGPGVRDELRRMFPGLDLAEVPAAVVRQSEFAIERRPAECGDFRGDAGLHVVIGPPAAITRLEYERRARRIATHPDVAVVGN